MDDRVRKLAKASRRLSELRADVCDAAEAIDAAIADAAEVFEHAELEASVTPEWIEQLAAQWQDMADDGEGGSFRECAAQLRERAKRG